jgi:hypothetical protein
VRIKTFINYWRCETGKRQKYMEYRSESKIIPRVINKLQKGREVKWGSLEACSNSSCFWNLVFYFSFLHPKQGNLKKTEKLVYFFQQHPSYNQFIYSPSIPTCLHSEGKKYLSIFILFFRGWRMKLNEAKYLNSKLMKR